MKRYMACISLLFCAYSYGQLDTQLANLKDALELLTQALQGNVSYGQKVPPPPPLKPASTTSQSLTPLNPEILGLAKTGLRKVPAHQSGIPQEKPSVVPSEQKPEEPQDISLEGKEPQKEEKLQGVSEGDVLQPEVLQHGVPQGEGEDVTGQEVPPPPPPPGMVCKIPKKDFTLQEFTFDELTSEQRNLSDDYVIAAVGRLGKPLSKKPETLYVHYKEVLQKLTKLEAFNEGFRFPKKGDTSGEPSERLTKILQSIVREYETRFKKDEHEPFDAYLNRMSSLVTAVDALLEKYTPLVFDVDGFKTAVTGIIRQSSINVIAGYRKAEAPPSIGGFTEQALQSDDVFMKIFAAKTIQSLQEEIQLLRINKTYLKYAQIEFDIANPPAASGGVQLQAISEKNTLFSIMERLDRLTVKDLKSANIFWQKYMFNVDDIDDVNFEPLLKNAQQIQQSNVAQVAPLKAKKQVKTWQDVIALVKDFDAIIAVMEQLYKQMVQLEKPETKDLQISFVPLGKSITSYMALEIPTDSEQKKKLVDFLKLWVAHFALKKYDLTWLSELFCALQNFFTDVDQQRLADLYSVYVDVIKQDEQLMQYLQDASSSAALYEKLVAEKKQAFEWLLDLLADPYRTPEKVITQATDAIKNKKLMTSSLQMHLKKIMEPYGMLMSLSEYYADLIGYKMKSDTPQWERVIPGIIATLEGIASGQQLAKEEIPSGVPGIMSEQLHKLKTGWGKSAEVYTAESLQKLIDAFKHRNSKDITSATQTFTERVGITQLDENARPLLEKTAQHYKIALLQEIKDEFEQLKHGRRALVPGLGGTKIHRSVYSMLANDNKNTSLMDTLLETITPLAQGRKITQQDIQTLHEAAQEVISRLTVSMQKMGINDESILHTLTNYFDAKIATVKSCME